MRASIKSRSLSGFLKKRKSFRIHDYSKWCLRYCMNKTLNSLKLVLTTDLISGISLNYIQNNHWLWDEETWSAKQFPGFLGLPIKKKTQETRKNWLMYLHGNILVDQAEVTGMGHQYVNLPCSLFCNGAHLAAALEQGTQEKGVRGSSQTQTSWDT